MAVETMMARAVALSSRIRVGVIGQDPIPDGCIPHIPAQIDAKDRLLRVDRLRTLTLGCHDSELINFASALR